MTPKSIYMQYAPNLFKLMAKRGRDDFGIFNLEVAKMFFFSQIYSYAVALPCWEGLDESIKPDILERIAIDNGNVVIHYDPILEKYVTLILGEVKEWDNDGRPRLYSATPLYTGDKVVYKNLTPENSVIIYDSITQIPTITTIDFYAARLANIRMTLDQVIKNLKVPYIIRTTSDNMAAVQALFNEIYSFKPAVIEDGIPDLETLKAYTLTDDLDTVLKQVREEYDQTLVEALRAIGVNTTDDKRERIGQIEAITSMGQSVIAQDVRLKPRMYAAEQMRTVFANCPKPMNDVKVTFSRTINIMDGINDMYNENDESEVEEDEQIHT